MKSLVDFICFLKSYEHKEFTLVPVQMIPPEGSGNIDIIGYQQEFEIFFKKMFET